MPETQFVVRAIADGQLISQREFKADQEHTADAFYESTVDRYSRSDDSEGVTVQMIRGEEVVYERTLD